MDEQKKARVKLLEDLADWRFDRYLTMQLLPWFYLILVMAATLLTIIIVVSFFQVSMLAGITALLAAPFGLLVAVAVVRAALEYLVMAHRIMNIIERMDALPDQVSGVSTRVEGISDHVDHLVERVERMEGTLTLLRPLLESTNLPKRLINSLRGKPENGKPGE
ncbi:hypothetical protein A11A3_03112 [Alcanivorax hongdengensis A-11-3]|uniref:DUF4282 domain-containing protein n=1 Tax=Alcanivorax hongdengensis A-11-3 TaxID=1177179 RepID=L0WJ02_9GAMM|nr:DUF4282 domain-containing protein [Alcanivorax hongdengensis]EKF75825.1 hypothetical protein A11A3_03112 [Alcanivorax hongdengensis A-11-3]